MYTVSIIGFESHHSLSVGILSRAAFLKTAWEKNMPWAKGSVVVHDCFGYLVPASELEPALASYKWALLHDLSVFEDA